MRPRHSAKIATRALPFALLGACLLLLFPTSAFALFTNGGLESGNFTGWTTTTFLNPGLSGSQPFTGASIVRNGGGSSYTSVLGSPTTAEMSLTDANTNGVLHYPLSGHYCAVVNYQGAMYNGNTLTQTAAVGQSDVKSDGKVHVQFAWAAVVQDPNHTASEQPYVYVHVRDTTKGTDLYSSFIFAGAGSIWNSVGSNGTQYTNWQVIDLAPGTIAVDDSIELDVTAAGCAQGGHWGYVYVDHFGSFQPVTPSVTAATKPYDGTTAATIAGGSLSGVQGSDDVNLSTSGATATFDSAAPGTGKTVTAQGLALGGTDADKYMLSSSTATTTADVIGATTVTAQAPNPDLKPGGTTTVTATATDGSGNPMAGQLITFTAIGGTRSPTSAFTDASGHATTTFTAGSTEGPATITATNYGTVKATVDVFVDKTVPSTTASNTAATSISGWVDRAVLVTLTPADNSPDGCVTFYELDGASSPMLYTGPISVSAEGSHPIAFWSVDTAGNIETHEQRFVNIDETDPIVTSSADTDTSWHGQDVTVTLSPADPSGSGTDHTEYSTDGGTTWQTASGDQVLVPAGSTNGAVTYEYRAFDKAGNESDTGTFTIDFDTTAPTVTSSEDAGSAWHDRDVTVTLSPADTGGSDVDTTQYKLHGSGTWLDATGDSFTAPAASNNGAVVYDYRALDNAGNASATGSFTIDFDTTRPTVTSSEDADSAWHADDVTVTLSPADSGGSDVDHTQYSADGGATWQMASGDQFTVPAGSNGSNDGSHTYLYRALDNAGNVSATGSCTVNIDTTLPTVTSSEDHGNGWSGHDVTVTLHSSDGGGSDLDAVQYRPAGATTWLDGNGGLFSVSAPADGSNDGVHVYEYQATDGAGNITQGTCTVRIDTQPPVTNVDVTHDDASGDVTITFQPSDMGSGMSGGLAATQYQVDGGAWQTGPQLVLRPLADGSTDGPHTVTYKSTDALGHVEVTRTATLNLTAVGGGGSQTTTYAPQTALLGLNGIWRNTDADLSLHAYEDPAGPGIAHSEYSLDDGQSWTTGTSLVIAAPENHANDGPHVLCYRSIDKDGTVEATRIAVVGIDTRKPTAVAKGASSAWRNTPLTLALGGVDPTPSSGIARVEYSTTGGNSWTARDALTVSTGGVSTVLYRAIDDAGNVSDSKTATVRIDTSRPWTRALATSGRRGSRVKLRFRIHDGKPSCGAAKVTIVVRNKRNKVVARYRMSGWYKTNATDTRSVRLKLAKGSYRFSVLATDRAGNAQSKALAGRLKVR